MCFCLHVVFACCCLGGWFWLYVFCLQLFWLELLQPGKGKSLRPGQASHAQTVQTLKGFGKDPRVLEKTFGLQPCLGCRSTKKRSPGEVAPLPMFAGQRGPIYSGTTWKSKVLTLTHQEAWLNMLLLWKEQCKRPKPNWMAKKKNKSLWKRAHLPGAGLPHPRPSLWKGPKGIKVFFKEGQAFGKG